MLVLDGEGSVEHELGVRLSVLFFQSLNPEFRLVLFFQSLNPELRLVFFLLSSGDRIGKNLLLALSLFLSTVGRQGVKSNLYSSRKNS